MRIDKVIHSCDANPFYLDFWPLVSKVWKKKFNIEPVLAFIGDKDIDIDDTYGTVIKIKPLEDVPIYLQTLWIRYWLPSTEPELTWMISDIDMIPMSEYYFVDKIKEISNDKYVHLNPCSQTYLNMFPSCYHVATGKSFSDVLSLPSDWAESVKMVLESGLGMNPMKLGGEEHLRGKDLWFSDEQYANLKLSTYSDQSKIVLLDREGGQNGYRVDRSHWAYREDLVLQQYYFDSHMIRPYSQYKHEIDKIVELVLKSKRSS